jgi:hypothetical protein
MTISASAIINGLTMLRAYHADLKVERFSGHGNEPMSWLAILVRWPPALPTLHADDQRRMSTEGWTWHPDPVLPQYSYWRLGEDA